MNKKSRKTGKLTLLNCNKRNFQTKLKDIKTELFQDNKDKNNNSNNNNLRQKWIHYKKAFDSVPYEWILRSLELFKVSPRIVDFAKYNMTNWKTQIILTYEKDNLMSDKMNIKKRKSSHCISLILSLELNSSRYEYKIGTERITDLFYIVT